MDLKKASTSAGVGSAVGGEGRGCGLADPFEGVVRGTAAESAEVRAEGGVVCAGSGCPARVPSPT
jgi:hypothetical protein